MKLFKEYCPRCRSTNITTIRESFVSALMRNIFNVFMPIRIFMSVGRKPKEQKVCRDCGFDWEKK